MSEHLVLNDTSGKSRRLLEIMTGKSVNELGSVEKLIETEGPEKVNDLCQKINCVEIKGVEDYARQVQRFVNGFPGYEAPYIFAGLKTFLDAALTAAPFNDPNIRQKYDMLLETIEKNTLRVVFTRKSGGKK